MSYFSQIGALTVQQFVSPAVGIAVGDRHGAGLLPAELADDRELLGGHHPLHALHPAPDRIHLRHLLRRQRRRADPRRTCMRPRHDERRHPVHRPRPEQDSWVRSSSSGPTAVASSTSTWPTPSRTRPGSPTALHLAPALDPVRAHLHLRQDGGQHQARRRAARGHGADLRCMGRLHELFRAHEQPRRRRGRRPLDRREHGGQRGPLRRHDQCPVQHIHRRRPPTVPSTAPRLATPRWAASDLSPA